MKKRIIATILSIALILTQVPWTALDVLALTSLDVADGSKVADNATTGDWQAYFGINNGNVSTEFAGGVWTDKSVFAGGTALDGITFANTGEDTFLVATSAISSTKQVTGFEYLPTDTVFVLDVSGSMDNSELQDMVEAANIAITELLKLNSYNRVGVVAYNPQVATLLEIDRYTTTKTAVDDKGTTDTSDDETYNVYLEYSNGYLRTARSYESFTLNVDWQSVVDLYTGNNWGGNANENGSAKNFFRNNDQVWALVQAGIPEGKTFSRSDWRSLVDNARTGGGGGGGNRVDSEADWLSYLQRNAAITSTTPTYVVKGSDGVAEQSTKATGDGTYTQLGIYQGRTLFEAKDGDTVIDTGLIQGGTKRMPIMVLMTDGAPTYGKSDYTFANNTTRDMGNGSDVTWELAFTTQATATHTLSVMERVYDREGLFYTLGLGVTETQAASVLDPENNTSTSTQLTGWWNAYKNPNATSTTLFTYGNGYNSVTVSRQETALNPDPADTSLTNISISEMTGNFPYADKYFPATNSAGLITAFDSIVEQIKIQSQYYPTLVTTGEYDMDGYVTIVDELGEYMEVENVRGLLYSGTLYTGAHLIADMYKGSYGNASTWTERGWELVYTIKERLDVAATGDNVDSSADSSEYGTPIEVTNDVVISLLQQAWRDGQLSGTYDSATNTVSDFSNYISYYANAKGQYLGFHDKDHTALDYPQGAKYIGRSYLFSGNITGAQSSISDTEMMHIVVQVYEDINTGHETVTWRVPASLIPTVLYEIEVEGNQLTETSIRTIKYTPDTPIRLVYEVGLTDELTPVNMVEKLGEYPYTTGDGGYYFYSNRWGDGEGITELDPNNHKATVAHYSPSVENERYYFTEDTVLYIKSGDSYVPYTGTARPTDMYPNDSADSGYYRPHKIITGTGSTTGAAASLTTKWIPVDAAVLSNPEETKQTDDGTNQWYVVKGTIYKQIARFSKAKEPNVTETLTYIDYPVVAHPTGEETSYDVFAFLGNNGRLTVVPGTGLKLTKDVAEVSAVSGAENDFTFTVTFDKAPTALKVTDADYNDVAYTSAGSNTIEVTLKDGETVYITGLAADTTYTVTEKANVYYTIQSVSAETVTDNVAGGVAALGEIDAVEFVNTAASFKGDLQITKTVTHPYGDGYVIPADKLFDVTVQFTGTDVANATFTATGTVNGGTAIDKVTTDAEGKAELQLAHEDSVTIIDLPHGVTYTVSEPALPAGFTNTSSTGLTGEIVTDRTAYAHLINNYTPEWETSEFLDLYVTKNLEGITWDDLAGGSFTFLLEKYEPTTQSWVDTGRQLVSTKEVPIALLDGSTTKVPFSYIGTHYYRLSEVVGTIEGITYDATHAYFSVVVTDNDMDGKTEIDIVAANNTTVEQPSDENGNVHIVRAQFTNRYNSTTANINIHKNLTNTSGIDVAMNNFKFVLCTSEECTGTGECAAVASHIEVTPNVNGDVIIPLSYTKNDVTGEAEVKTTYGDIDASVDYVVNPENALEATKTGTVKATETAVKTLTETYYLKEVTGNMAGMVYDGDIIPVEVTVTVTETTEYDVTKTVNYTREAVAAAAENSLDEDQQAEDENVSVEGQQAEGEDTSVEGQQAEDEDTSVEDQQAEDENASVEGQQAEDENTPVAQQTEYTEWKQSGDPVITGEKPSTATPVVTLESSVVYNSDAALTAAQFNNTYTVKPATAAIGGNKTYNRSIEAGQFTFNLYETDSTFAVAANAAAKATATVDAVTSADGTAVDAFSFAEITYDKAGTYYYVVKEAMPAGATAANNYTVNGITYDPAEYHVTVVVSLSTTEGEEDQLVASQTIHQVGGSGTAIAFANSYSITSGTTAALRANKALTGRALNKDDFTFYLYNKNDVTISGSTVTVAEGKSALQTTTNSAYNTVSGNTYTGTVQFEAIPYTMPGTYEYVIVEAIPAEAVLNSEGEYELNGITYDTTPYVYATVVVKDNGDGTLAVESVTYDNASATIENTYIPTPVTEIFAGKKLYAANEPFEAKEVTETFRFALYKADKNFTPETTAFKTVDGVKSATKGYVDFSIAVEYTSAGDYYYVLRELAGSVPTTSYDTKVYNIAVTVRDDGNGTLSAIPHIYLDGVEVTTSFGATYDFLNLYYPQEARASVQVSKTVENTTGVELTKEGFRFGLYTTKEAAELRGDDYVATALTDDDGNAYVELKYTDTQITDHVNTTYFVYYLAEMYADKDNNLEADVIGGMEYDQNIYRVTVAVKYDSDVLKAEVTEVAEEKADGTWAAIQMPVAYTNIYDLAEANFSVTAEKVLDGRDLLDGEFTFELYQATVSGTEWTKGSKLDTQTNVGKNVTFDSITYSTIGTHFYIVEEVVPADADKLKGVTYDTTQYKVVVTVTDNGEGALVAAVTEINGAAPSDTNKVVFNNKFKSEPIEVEISGTKQLSNRAPLEGEFEFAIYEADTTYNIIGNALATVKNAADGTFTFTNEIVGGNKLYFEDAETRRFVVKEVIPEDADPTITYSTFEHNIEVKVTKRSDGQLISAVRDTTGTSSDLIIQNTYTSKSTTAQIDIEKTLVNETGVNLGVSVKDFTFGLYTNEACTVPYTRNGNHVTVSPDDDGNFDSAVIIIPYTDASYKAATTYTYYLKEIVPAAANRVPMMNYDNSVYKVVVTLSYDANNNLVATPAITKIKDANGLAVTETAVSKATFDNVYDLGSASITLDGTKVYEGWTNNPDETFDFELYQTDVSGNYAATGSQLIGTASVTKADPSFTFTSASVPQLSFTKAGTYYFAVREDNGGLTLVDNGHGIIYSGTQYVVAVKVSENVVNGRVTGLKAEKVVYHYGNKPEGLDEAVSFEGFESDNIRFTNIDLDGKATIDFVGKKAIENANMADYDQTFDFALYQATVNGSQWTLVDSKPDTTAVDPMLSTENRENAAQQANDGYNIEFIGVPLEYAGDGSHTYHFVVKELNGGHPTIGYDATEYKITVTAAFTTSGTGADIKHNYTITSVVVNGQNVQFTTTNEGNKVVVLLTGADGNAFENTYTSYGTVATIPVEKALSNTTGVAMDKAGFVFGVYTDAECKVPYTVNGEQVTTITGQDGKAEIVINYTDKDVSVLPHVYYLKEMYADKDGDGAADTIPGMTYSSQIYKVEVTVAFDTTNGTKLVATPVISTVDADGIAAQLIVNRAEFENTYALDPATLGLEGKKVIEDHVIYSYDLRFDLHKAATEQPSGTVIADANGVWTKGARVEEVANVYQSDASSKDFDIFKFSELTFDKAGTYYYIISEQKGVLGGVVYDESSYQITVTVAPHTTENKLVAAVTDIDKVSYSYDGIYIDSNMTFEGVLENKGDADNTEFTVNDFVFTNIYRPLGTFTVGGEKAIENRDWKEGDSFTFEIYYADKDGNEIDAYSASGVNPLLTETVKYNAAGEYSFTFEDVIVSMLNVDSNKVAQIGTQYFVIKEVSDSALPAMSYDTTKYLITVNTKDNGNGTLAAGKYDADKDEFTEGEFVVEKLEGENKTPLAATETITFVNTYNTVLTIPAEAVIKGEKQLTGRDIVNGEFTFELYTADSSWTIDSTVNPVTAKNIGKAFEFANEEVLTFDRAGTYYFVVKEQKGNNAAIKYDTTEYKVEVVVSDTGRVENGKAVLEVTGTTVHAFDNKITFTNSYNPAEFTININKALTLKNGAKHPLSGFKFEVYDVVDDERYEVVSNAEGKQTVTIKYNEKHLGENNAPKAYTYKITEVDTDIDGMTYDATEYVIEVTVYAENGQIKTRVTQQGTDLGTIDSTSVQFNNTYKGKDVPKDPEDPGKPVVIVPDTGDTTDNMLYIGLMAFSAVCAFVIFLIIKKRKDEEEAEA